MRKKLGKIEEQRLRFRAIFDRYGTKSGYKGRVESTILLKDLCEISAGEHVTDHLWFNHTKGFRALGTLHLGDVVEFDARVKKYKKGYWGRDKELRLEHPPGYDWHLSYPTRIEHVVTA